MSGSARFPPEPIREVVEALRGIVGPQDPRDTRHGRRRRGRNVIGRGVRQAEGAAERVAELVVQGHADRA